MSESHREKYRRFARERHIAITNLSLFRVSSLWRLRELAAADPHLNNISLALFDGLTHSYNFYNPRNRMTLAEGTSVYKTLLLDLAEHGWPK
jgi:hypothetical protein